ncbi:MAG: uroporphyrinogen-III synthase [Acidobacteriaceae bacterium]|nr:uroporphyrinogen-III synthase [Acidobacteriaceae bacterium]
MSGPLSGRTVVVTRARHQAEELAAPVRAAGARVVLLPMIAIAAPMDIEPLRRAAQQVNDYDWIIFSSSNAVLAFTEALTSSSLNVLPRIAAVGAATRELAEERGLRVSLVPDDYVAESLVSAFDSKNLTGSRVLIPTAERTRDIIAPALRARGASVELVTAYRNIVPENASADATKVFADSPPPDWLTFASSSAFENLLSVVRQDFLRKSKIASIGPVTSRTVREHGLTVTAEADPHTVPALVEAIVQYELGR